MAIDDDEAGALGEIRASRAALASWPQPASFAGVAGADWGGDVVVVACALAAGAVGFICLGRLAESTFPEGGTTVL